MPILAGDDPLSLAAAAQRLAAGGLVALPTETVYGLGARADEDAAVAAIFSAKGRPADHPLIVHVAGPAQAEAFADGLPPLARQLMQAFWPGPLTVIVPRRPGVASAAAAGQASVGLRCPSHPVARALLQQAAALGGPAWRRPAPTASAGSAPPARRMGCRRSAPTCGGDRRG